MSNKKEDTFSLTDLLGNLFPTETGRKGAVHNC